MQHIGLRVEDESAKVIKDLSLVCNFVDILKPLQSVLSEDEFKEKYPWVASVDPYGTTVLNYLQIPHLTRELASAKLILDEKDVSRIDIFLEFLKDNSVEKSRFLLRFIGD